MPFIQVTLAQGRSADQKEQLVRAVSKAAADAVGVAEASVRVWLVEVDPANLMVGGETMADRTARNSASS